MKTIIITADTIAVVFYLATALYQGLFLLQRSTTPPNRTLLLTIGSIAVIAHAGSIILNTSEQQTLDLSFYHISSLIFWFISAIVLLSTLHRPTDNLLVGLFPLAALSIIVSAITPSVHSIQAHYSIGLFIHILTSILAYSLLTIAALQALLLAIQDKQLKHHHTHGMLQALPPLQTMEALLFDIIWLGLLMLSISIATGFVFVDNLFAQHLVHKTVLTIASWCMFVVLLWGHYRAGWRSQTAVRWTLGGFIVLMLGYFGSKWVLEVVLQRV